MARTNKSQTEAGPEPPAASRLRIMKRRTATNRMHADKFNARDRLKATIKNSPAFRSEFSIAIPTKKRVEIVRRG